MNDFSLLSAATAATGPVLVDQTSISQNGSIDQNDPFWFTPTINPLNWNKAYPYTLMILERDVDSTNPNQTNYKPSGIGNFVLPFAPESLSLSILFAVSTTPTLGGIIEEHNGAPFRIISMNGTLGVLPTRSSSPQKQTSNPAQSIFGGVIGSGQATVNSATSAINLFNGTGTTGRANLIQPTDLGDANTPSELGKSSGYYQMELLKKFLEDYHNLKKASGGAKYQLALGLFKQQGVYLVSAMSFVSSQTAASPLEYTYQLQLKAWKRINPNNFPSSDYQFTPVVRQPSDFYRLMNAMQDAQLTLQNAQDTLAATAGDIQATLFEPLRQSIFFAKDTLGVGLTLADTSLQIARESRDAVILALSGQNAVTGFASSFSSIGAQIINLASKIGQPTLGSASTGNITVTSQSQGNFQADPGNDPFNNPQDYFSLFSQINISSLNLPPVTMRKILAEREQIRLLTRLDFENMRDTIVNVQADFADKVGAGSAAYNATYGRPNVTSTRTPTETDFNVIFALNNIVLQMNQLAATYQTNLTNVPSINFVAGAASRSGIAFNVPASKFQVPFPYGFTLEQVSTQYLGSPDHWLEIAALNGLQAPYVDEEGFDLPLLTNGKGNTVTVSDASNLFLGQAVWLSSTSTIRTQRSITKITPISNSYVIVTVNGDADLARFSALSGATLHAFLPNTVNSMQAIYIPSATPPDSSDYQTKAIPGISDYDTFLQAGGVDLLLTANNDLAITPDGDCRLAIGLTNIIQQARIAMTVTRGSLNRHPSFGIPKLVGQSTADVDVNQVVNSLSSLFAGNSTFTGVNNINVTKAGPSVVASMNLNVKGINQLLPVTFKLNL
jgi:hypothetical protein